MTPLALLVPGPIDQLTGGYLYARRLVDGLRARCHAVAVHELPGRFPAADDRARSAAAAVLAGLPAGAVVVIDGLALAGFECCLAGAAQRLHLLAFMHHPLAAETGLSPDEAASFAALEARLLPLLRGVICPSKQTAAAVAAYGVGALRIAVAPPGTEKPAQPVARAPHGGPLRLLSVATVTPRKGHCLLVEALARLPARAWTLEIVGSLTRDPATVAALRQAIVAHGLASRVTLAGERSPHRLADAYAAADLFVLASFHEGYGMVFAEALAHGLPVIGTTAGAIPELVPPSAGILVPPGDTAALAAALTHVMDDPALRARLAAGAAATGAALPTWDHTITRWTAAVERIVHSQRE